MEITNNSNHALFQYIDENNLDGVQSVLEKGENVNYEIAGISALMFAILKGNVDMIRLLILNRADVNHITSDSDWETPLLIASKVGNIEIVKELFRNGSDPSVVIRSGFQEGKNSIMVASEFGHADVVREHITHGVDVNTEMNRGLYIGETALMLASKNGHFEVVKVLLEHGANVNASTEKGETATSFACNNGHLLVLQELMIHGAMIPMVNHGWNDQIKRFLADEPLRRINIDLLQRVREYENRILYQTNDCEEQKAFIMSECHKRMEADATIRTTLEDQIKHLSMYLENTQAEMNNLRGGSVQQKKDIETLNSINEMLRNQLKDLEDFNNTQGMSVENLRQHVRDLERNILELKSFLRTGSGYPQGTYSEVEGNFFNTRSRHTRPRDPRNNRTRGSENAQNTRRTEQKQYAFKCVRPYPKDKATHKERRDSCQKVEGVPKGPNEANLQKCVESCHT